MKAFKRALISVSNKSGVADFALALQKFGFEIISTGGTSTTLRDAGVEVTEVSEVTGFPEMMDGRVKTLHPGIHAGLLARRDKQEHLKEVENADIKLIDLVAVNLYPFRETIDKENVRLEEVIENIDIGGPTLLRSAAKNYTSVTVVADPLDYDKVLKEIHENGDTGLELRERLAVKAFRHTAEYDSTIDKYLSKRLMDEDILRLSFVDGIELRYGENWHQKAKFYREAGACGATLSNAVQLHGKELSYNNYVDADSAMRAVVELDMTFHGKCCVAIVKHNTPCGISTGDNLRGAIEASWDGDPISSFGSIMCTNQVFNIEAAEYLRDKFVEVILCPGYDEAAIEFLRNKSKNIRLLALPGLLDGFKTDTTYRHILGGMLTNSLDVGLLYEKWENVTEHKFPDEKRELGVFAILACKYIRSNAISIVREYSIGCYHLIGMGAGQPNRVDAMRKLGVTKARENLELIYERIKPDKPLERFIVDEMREAVSASDAFMPFDDTVVHAADNNIRYILSSGGSIRDQEVIDTANRLGVAMIFTGVRYFLH